MPKRRTDIWDIVAGIAGFFAGEWVADRFVPTNKILNLLVIFAVVTVVYVAYAALRYALFDKNA